MSDLKTVLSEMGASKQQLGSPIVAYCEKALAENKDFVAGISESRAEDIIKRIGIADQRLNDVANRLSKISRETAGEINNGDTKDAVIAYRMVLETTKEVFGSDCSQDVICKAIEAGSYIAWRGIMGPKQEGVTRRI